MSTIVELPKDTVVATAVNLRDHAPMLITMGMFDADGGRHSGMLSDLQASLEGAPITAYYFMSPRVGIAFLSEYQDEQVLSVYVYRNQRGKGYARALIHAFTKAFEGQITQAAQFHAQPPIDKLVKASLGWTVTSNDDKGVVHG